MQPALSAVFPVHNHDHNHYGCTHGLPSIRPAMRTTLSSLYFMMIVRSYTPNTMPTFVKVMETY